MFNKDKTWWKNHKDILLTMIDEVDDDLANDIEEIIPTSKRLKTSDVKQLNGFVAQMDKDVRAKFLRRCRDFRYDNKKKRIRINEKSSEVLAEFLKRYQFSSEGEAVDFILSKITYKKMREYGVVIRKE